jgi:shikimate kinase
MAKHISLIGMMGAGKSSVAPIVAQHLNRQVIEVDELIVQQEGIPISEIFMAKGEAYFRRVESAMIDELIKQPPAVLSLGGGAFQWESTRQLLLGKTVVFYLAANLEVLAARVEVGRASRPLLNVPGVNFKDTLRETLERREPYYKMAHYRVETNFHTPLDVAKSIEMMREAYE